MKRYFAVLSTGQWEYHGTSRLFTWEWSSRQGGHKFKSPDCVTPEDFEACAECVRGWMEDHPHG